MIVSILLFARLKREAGTEAAQIEVAEGTTVRELAREVERRYGIALAGCMTAVNERYATPDTALSPRDEVAFLPPVAGGGAHAEQSELEHCEVTASPINLTRAHAFLMRAEWGAQAYFVGTVRSPNKGLDVAYLEYEAYPPMAVRVMRDAVELARGKYAIGGAYVVHRIGHLEPAEPSILIGVGSPHRRAALEACDFLIEHLKVQLPVWKLEVGENGERWVEGSTGAPTL